MLAIFFRGLSFIVLKTKPFLLRFCQIYTRLKYYLFTAFLMKISLIIFSCITVLFVALIPSISHESIQNHIFAATYLQYGNETQEKQIYQNDLKTDDISNLRATSGQLDNGYISDESSIPGSHGAEFTSLYDLERKLDRVKNLGYDFVAYNLENNTSPKIDSDNVVVSMQNAAYFAHLQGLKFRAVPSKQFTKLFGAEIAKFSDYYGIQGQSKQMTCGTSDDQFRSFIDSTVPILRAANPQMIITVQVSTQQGVIPGQTMLNTLKNCTTDVNWEVDGFSIWFGSHDFDVLNKYIIWYHGKYT